MCFLPSYMGETPHPLTSSVLEVSGGWCLDPWPLSLSIVVTLHERFNSSKRSIMCHLGTERQAEGQARSPQAVLAFVLVTIRPATFSLPALTSGGHLQNDTRSLPVVGTGERTITSRRDISFYTRLAPNSIQAAAPCDKGVEWGAMCPGAPGAPGGLLSPGRGKWQ